ncbi:MAG: hypothetical protein AAF363_18815 [Bacteroidota bacterium]
MFKLTFKKRNTHGLRLLALLVFGAILVNSCTDDDTAPVDIVPLPDFSSSQELDGFVVIFADSTTFSRNLSEVEDPDAIFAWDFGVEGIDTDVSTEESPSFDYTDFGPGTYSVTLIVTSSTDFSNEVIQELVVEVPSIVPQAAFTSNLEEFVASFTNTTTFSVAATEDPEAVFAWDFGVEGIDTDVSTEESPSFDYEDAGPGTYTVTLTVTSSTGDEDVTTEEINIQQPAILPVAAFTPTVDNFVVSFANMTTFSGGATEDPGATFTWDFGVEGDDTDVSTEESPSFDYTIAGANTYAVTLTVTSSTGDENVTTEMVTIEEPLPTAILPVAAFTSTIDAFTANFMNTTIFSGAATEDPGATFAWDFGVAGEDTDVSTEESPSFDYTTAGAGTYTVMLTVTSSTGNESVATEMITITSGVSNQAAIIRDLQNDDTGELRFDIDASLTGRLEVTFTRTELVVDEVSGNGRDAFIALLNSTGSTSSQRSIIDLRINDDSFEIRDQDAATFNAVPTPGILQTAVITWSAPNATTPPNVTFTIDGEEATAPFTSGANAIGGVERVQFRLGDNSSTIASDQNFTIERFDVFSNTAGTGTPIFSTDFGTFMVGEALDGTDDPFSSSSSDATVEEL